MDSLRLRVVPAAQLVAYHLPSTRFALLDVTGRNVRVVPGQGTLLTSFMLAPRFDASRPYVILPRSFQAGGDGPFTVTIVDTSGTPAGLRAGAAGAMRWR